MRILGVWDGHDSGAALLVDGRLVAAINEERLSRRKLEIRFPERSIQACLTIAGLTPPDVEVIAVSTTDIAKALARWFPSTKEAYYAVRRRKARPGVTAGLKRQSKYWITEWGPNRASHWLSQIMLQRELHRLRFDATLHLVDHHRAHAAAAAFASGMDPCVVVTIDGVGDGLSSSISAFRDGQLARVAASPARHSLGIFFEHVTHLLNMRELEDEGKVMALADHASPIPDADNPLLSLITVVDGRFWSAKTGHALLSRLKRIQWFYANEQFAYMAQRVIELRTVEMVRDAVRLTGLRRVALAGGVVSNVKANRHIRLMPEVDDVYVFPHMGDGGLALGAAVAAATDRGQRIALDFSDLGFGPEYSTQCLATTLEASGLRVVKCVDLPERVADLIARDAIVLWFQGRMEYGPRSLGRRSVLARPDSRAVRDRLNLVLKRRVWYQPFCPSLLESDAARVFSDWSPSANSHMTMAYMVSPAYREAMAGVIGVDGSCRPQIVSDNATDCFAELLRAVRRRLNLAVVLNTSYNIHGEPLVCSPEDALDVFKRCGADALAVGPYLFLPLRFGVTEQEPRTQMVTDLSRRHDRLRRTAPIVFGWFGVVAVLAIWLGSTPDFELRDQLRRWQFWFLEAQFALLIAVTAVNLGPYVRSLSLSRQDYLWAAAAVGLVVLLAGAVAPLTNRIFYDEQIYQGVGQNLTDLRLAQMCNDGTVEYGHLQCWRGEYNKQPYGYPHLLSVVYRIFGVSYWTAPRFNVLCAALLVGVVFLIARGLFEDCWAARAAALIAALIPEQLRWFHSAAAEPSAAVAGAFAVLASVHFVRARTTLSIVWLVAATAFALQFRIESVLIVVVVALTIALWAPAEFGRPRLWGWSLFGLILSAALVGHLVAIRQEQWGTPGDKISLEFVGRNLATNARFYLADPRFPALYTVLALYGLARFRERRPLILNVTYFFLFWGVYLLFYAGSYNYGADVRYSIMTYPPLALLAGAGAAELRRARPIANLGMTRAAALLVAALGLQFLWYLPLVRAVGEEAWAARADVEFAQRVAVTLPKNSIILTHNPSVFHVMGMNAAQLSFITNETGYVKQVLLPRYAGGVYLHWNFWCNVSDRVQQEFCETALQRFPHTLVREHRERDYRYGFYKLDILPAVLH